MVNVYLPSPLSVSAISLSRLSRTVKRSSSYPASGVTVMVTVVPRLARPGLTRTVPFSASGTVTA